MPTLTDLPPELIEEIVHQVYLMKPKQYLGTVSSLFLPISRQITFADIEIGSEKALMLLEDLLEASPSVEKHIRTLELCGRHLILPALRPSASPSPFSEPGTATLANYDLPNLHSLKLCGSTYGLSSFFNALFHFLSAHPNIAHMHLDRPLLTIADATDLPAPRHLVSLHLDQCLLPSLLSKTMSMFPNLRLLTLSLGEDEAGNEQVVLDAIHSPSCLRELSVTFRRRPPPSFFSALARLPNIERFAFSQVPDSTDAAKDDDWGIIAALHNFTSIAHLTIEPAFFGTFPKLPPLRTLLANPLYCPSLRSLTLEHVFLDRLRSQPQLLNPNRIRPTRDDDLGDGVYELPMYDNGGEVWKAEYEEARAELVKLARARGVQLRGGFAV